MYHSSWRWFKLNKDDNTALKLKADYCWQLSSLYLVVTVVIIVAGGVGVGVGVGVGAGAGAGAGGVSGVVVPVLCEDETAISGTQ